MSMDRVHNNNIYYIQTHMTQSHMMISHSNYSLLSGYYLIHYNYIRIVLHL